MSNVETDQVNLFLNFENRTVFRKDNDRQLPVTLITGPLGSGKTTMLSAILKNKENLRVCVAVNDFAQVNIDESTLSQTFNADETDTAVVALSNGCMCCSLMSDFRQSVSQIISMDQRFDYVVVETSGITDPWTIMAALDERFGKLFRARLDSVVCVVDATLLVHSDAPADRPDADIGLSDATRSQLLAADLIVVNKVDLIDAEQRARIETQLRALNPLARLRFTTFRCARCSVGAADVPRSQVPLHELLDIQVAESSAASSGVLSHEQTHHGSRFKPSLTGGALRGASKSAQRPDAAAGHNAGRDLVSFSCAAAPPFALAHFQDFLHQLPRGVVRGKGTLVFRDDVDDGGDSASGACIDFNLSGNGRHVDVRASATRARSVQLAFIGRRDDIDANALAAQLAACSAADGHCDVDTGTADAALKLVRADERFEALLLGRATLLFRVTAAHIGVDEGRLLCSARVWVLSLAAAAELRAYHGIHLDKVNRALLRAINAVNASTTPAQRLAPCFVTPRHHNDALWIRFALGGRHCTLAQLWPIVQRTAEPTLARAFRGVSGCKCSY